MRKVLLATTALVALNVSAASADVSISGTGTFDIEDSGSNTTWTSDGNIVIKGSTTTDSGLTLTAVQDVLFEGITSTGSTNANNVADSYIDIAGDFGSIRMGNTDNALDRMDGALPENMDLEGVADSGVAGAIGKDEVGISFISPSFNGITVYGSTTAEGSNTGVGANYKAGPMEVMVQSGSADQTAMAAKFTAGPVTVQVGAINVGKSTSKKEYRQFGASYTMGDVKFVATSQKEGTNKYSNIGAKYTVAPGLSVAAESGTQGSNSGTWVSVAVSF
jgi:predicted porin